jgi:cyclase
MTRSSTSASLQSARACLLVPAILTASLFSLLTAGADRLPAPPSERSVTKLADGVYLIRHKNAPDHFTQSNTVVVIGNTGVLVVDSCYLPSSAREDIAQIRQWTDKPVRYLFNTHWHGDHTQGNSIYAEAFPSVAIISQAETARLIPLRVSAYLAEYPTRMERFQHELDTGKDPGGRLLTDAEKEDLKIAVSGGKAAHETVSVEFRNLKVKVPDLAFDRSLDVDLGGRQVQLKFLGRGNTAGDAIAFLPKEKIVVAGDLVDSPVPFLYGGFPLEQIDTLKRLNELEFDTLVPGHGGVLQGRAFVQLEIELLSAAVDAMTQEIARTDADPQARYDEIVKAVEQRVDKAAWSRKFAGDDSDERDFFVDVSWPGLLLALHAELWPR